MSLFNLPQAGMALSCREDQCLTSAPWDRFDDLIEEDFWFIESFME